MKKYAIFAKKIQRMNSRKQLLKTMLPGLIPLLIFVIADSIWGTMVALCIAMVTAFVELAIVYLKERRFDRFVGLDLVLILIFSVLSLTTENDFCFKFKPALMELALAGIIAFSVFGPKNLISAMSQRYLKNIEINVRAEQEMNRNLKYLFYLTSGHIILVVYAAMYLSNEAWVFISSVLYYILIGFLFVGILVKKKFDSRKRLSTEGCIPVVTEEGEIVGSATKEECHSGKKIIHPVVHLHIFNTKGEILLQLRPKSKKVQPGKWDSAVGGHVEINETIEEALKRECFEELGIKLEQFQLLKKYIWDSDIEKELVFSFVSVHNGPFPYNKEELEDVKFWTADELHMHKNKTSLTPNFLYEFDSFLKNVSLAVN